MTYRIESDGNIYNDETGATVLLCADAKRLARRLIAERDRQAEYGRSYKYSYLRACEERDQARAWAAAWKRAAKNKREWLHVAAKVAAEQIVEHAHCQDERDKWKQRALMARKAYHKMKNSKREWEWIAQDNNSFAEQFARQRDEARHYARLYRKLANNEHELVSVLSRQVLALEEWKDELLESNARLHDAGVAESMAAQRACEKCEDLAGQIYGLRVENHRLLGALQDLEAAHGQIAPEDWPGLIEDVVLQLIYEIEENST